MAKRKNAKWRAFWAGLIFSNFVGCLAMFSSRLLFEQWSSDIAVTFLASQFIALPIGMGVVASFFWRKLRFTSAENAFGALAITGLGLFFSFIFLAEGAVCLIMAAPLVFLFVWMGVALGKFLWQRNPWLGASVLPIFVLLLIFDARTPHHHAAVVTDEILIHAPPARVWKFIAAYPKITAPPDYWLWKIGLPYPTQSTADGAFAGARRDCRFSGDVVFEEKIVEAKAPHILTFDVTKQPIHPEITGHFNLDRGRFELRDNGDGTTTLIGTTWYRLHIYPTQYFGLWADAIIRRVHFRVFEQVKTLAERDA